MKKLRQVFSIALAVTMIASTVSCKQADTSPTVAKTSSGVVDYAKAKPETLTLFSQTANFTGTQGGWFGKLLKDKFNITLKIISGQGDGANLYTTRSAAQDLGDIVIFGSNVQNFTDSIKAGLLMDLTPLLKTDGKYIQQNYSAALDRMKTTYGENKAIYGLPNNVSTEKATTSSDGSDLTYGNYLLWSAYKAAGSPTISTLEDLLPALQKMQKAHPLADNGKPTYGFSLFKDWDGTMMSNAKQYTCMYGYDEWGFMLIYADGSKSESILDKNGQYYRNLKLYHDANKLGLLDPDSYAQTQSDFTTKLKNGQILSNWWQWCCQPQYNTVERTASTYSNPTTGVKGADGYALIPMSDEKIISNGFSPTGVNYEMAIGSKCSDPQRAMALINWLYSPEGEEAAKEGPKGMLWDVVNGKPALTDLGKKALNDNASTAIPSEWGGGTYQDGQDKLADFKCVAENGDDPTLKEPYLYTGWSSYNSAPNDLVKEWSKTVGQGTSTSHTFLAKVNQMIVAPGTPIQEPVLSTDVSTEKNNVSQIIRKYSWNMVMTKNDAEFDKFWEQMAAEAKSAGIEDVDKAYAAQWNILSDARKKAMSES